MVFSRQVVMLTKIRDVISVVGNKLPSRITHERLYIAITVIVLLLLSNLVILYNGSYTTNDYKINRPLSLALSLYKDNDFNNPRFQRARVWFDSDYYDADLRMELSSNFKNFGQFDSRLAVALWLHMINENVKDSEEGLLPQDFKLPFTWNMILDLSSQLMDQPYYEKIIKDKLSCKQFSELDVAITKKYKDATLPTCIDYNYDKPNFPNPYDLPFKLTGPDNIYLEDINVRKISSLIHCLTGLPIPSRVVFLGGIDNMGSKKSLIVPLLQVEDTHHNLRTGDIKHSVLKGFSNLYIEKELQQGTSVKEILVNGLSVFKELHLLNEFILKSDKGDMILQQNLIGNGPAVFGVGERKERDEILSMPQDLFNWKIDVELDKLKNEILQNSENSSLLHLERLMLNKKDGLVSKEPKYWGLASSKVDRLDHFDHRFFRFNVKKEKPELHLLVLHRLTRTWFKLCYEFDVPTWLNHGPLIGWYWNGMNLNYDSDIDVQLPIQSLSKLTKLINDTLIYDFVNEKEFINDDMKLDNNAELGLRSFYFEVADSFISRSNLLSLGNNIDARLIDTQTGIYIDITALLRLTSHTDGIDGQVAVFNKMRSRQISRFILSQFYEEFYDGITLKEDIHDMGGDRVWKKIVTKSKKMLNEYINNLQDKQETLSNFVHDRNYHFYNLNELNPLIPSFFENYNTYIPSNFLKNLIVEYGDKNVILRPYFTDYKFFDRLKLWIQHKDCPVYQIGDGKLIFTMDETAMNRKCLLMNEKVQEDVERFKTFLEFHKQEFKILIGGDSRNETLLDMMMKHETELDYDSHKEFIKDRSNHILIPEPYLVDMFYD